MRMMMMTTTWKWVIRVIAVTVTLSVGIIPLKVKGNTEGDALYTLRRSLSDPDNALQSWDPTLVNPCTWFHITCNQVNRVTRVSVYHSLSLSLFLIIDLIDFSFLFIF